MREFIRDFPSAESILNYAATRKCLIERHLLVDAIVSTYGPVDLNSKQLQNLELLKNEKSLTVTCGHQLNVLGGPLYVVYKIQSAISLCKELNERQKEFSFLPVFWLASEDHDLEEISSGKFLGETLSWKTDQTGACGRMKTEGIPELIDQLRGIQGFDHSQPELVAQLETAYAMPNLALATVSLINDWFAHQGLLIVNGDNVLLKRAFLQTAKKDLQNGLTHQKVNETSLRLKELGYHNQTGVREVNYFRLSGNTRFRMDKTDTGIFVNGEDREVSLAELFEELDEHPGLLSPNVITRPIYQEFVLPNVVFVGGAGEISYWLQLGRAFEALHVPFPILLQRNSFALLTGKTHRLAEKAGLKTEDWYLGRDVQIRHLLGSQNELNFDNELLAISDVFGSLARKAGSADFTLVRSVESELAQTLGRIEHIKTKVLRALKQRNEAKLTQLDKFREVLFPEGILQERTWGMVDGTVKFSYDLLQTIQDSIEPLNSDFQVLIQDETATIPYNSEE